MSLTNFFNSMPDSATIHDDFKSFWVDWSAKGVGFGQFVFYRDAADGKLHIQNECMSKDFIKKVLAQLVDDAVLDEPN